MEIIRHEAIFMRFSILCEILPFIGKIDKWRYLLSLLSSKTSKIWTENKDGFEGLYYSSFDPHITPKEIEDNLINYTIELCCGSYHTTEFLKEASKFIYPQIKGLTIYNFDISTNEKGESNMKGFFDSFSISSSKDSYQIQNLRVVCGFQTEFNFETFKRILPKVKNRLLLSLFTFSKESILELINNCSQLNTIVLAACRIPQDVDLANTHIQNFNVHPIKATGKRRF